jgi:hypothetical protein
VFSTFTNRHSLFFEISLNTRQDPSDLYMDKSTMGKEYYLWSILNEWHLQQDKDEECFHYSHFHFVDLSFSVTLSAHSNLTSNCMR